MGKTELLKHTGVFGVGREEIADQGAFEGFAQDFLENLGTPASFDSEKAKELRAKGPYPIPAALIPMTGFVDMKTGLLSNRFFQFLVRLCQRLADSTNLIAQHRT